MRRRVLTNKEGLELDNALICTYYITDTSTPAQLLHDISDTDYFKYQIIDGEILRTASRSAFYNYQFSTTGNHVVQFVLKDNTLIRQRLFKGVTLLKKIVIPDTVITIHIQAFEETSNIEVEMGNNVQIIGDSAFAESSISSIYPKGQPKQNHTILLPDSVTTLGANIFSNFSGLLINAWKIIGPNVTDIGSSPFSHIAYGWQTNSDYILIFPKIEKIGRYFFGPFKGGLQFNPDSNRDINIPESVTFLGARCFYSNHQDYDFFGSSLYIWKNLQEVEENPFYKSDFESISVDPENIYFDSRDNCNALIRTTDNRIITACSNTTIPNSVTEIGNYAFYSLGNLPTTMDLSSITYFGFRGFQSTNIEELILSSSNLITLENEVFSSMYYLSKINSNNSGEANIPQTITSISNGCFQSCSKINRINIPSSVTSIGANAFTNCGKQAPVNGVHLKVFINNNTPPTLGNNVFGTSSGSYIYVIYVPSSAVNTYKNASGWSTYASHIQAIPT